MAAHDPDPIPLVRCADVVRAQNSPFRSEPHLGQVSEYGSESPSSKNWAVLHECVAGSNLANDAGHLFPES